MHISGGVEKMFFLRKNDSGTYPSYFFKCLYINQENTSLHPFNIQISSISDGFIGKNIFFIYFLKSQFFVLFFCFLCFFSPHHFKQCVRLFL